MPAAGFIGVGQACPGKRRGGVTAPFSVAITGLTQGRAQHGTTLGFTTNPTDTVQALRWQSSAGGAAWVDIPGASSPTHSIDITGGTHGDGHALRLGVTIGAIEVFSGPVLLAYGAPTLQQSLIAQSFPEGSGVQTYDASIAFAGDNLGFSISPAAGITIDPNTGLISFDTAQMAPQTDTPLSVTATNSGGSVQTGLALTITVPQTIILNIQGLTSGIAEIGTHTSLTLAPPNGVSFTAQSWGTSYGDTGFGTNTSPTDLTTSDGFDLQVQAQGDDGNTYRASAPIRYGAPIAAGGIADQDFTQNSAIPALDVAGDFTGQALSFALAPVSAPLPAGLTLSANGQITGTPTTITAQAAIVVRATNSGGFADSGFGLTISDNSTFAIEEIAEEPVITATDGNISITIGSGPYAGTYTTCLLYTSPSPRDRQKSRMPSSA